MTKIQTLRDARRQDDLMDALAERADAIVAATQALALANFEVKRVNSLLEQAIRLNLGSETIAGYNADFRAALEKRNTELVRYQRVQIGGEV